MAASQGVGGNSGGSGCGGGGSSGGGGSAGGGSGAGAGGGSGTLVLPIPVPTLFGQPVSNGPQWNPGSLQPQHTVRSLDRALEEAGNSGILSLSGRKLREFPGSCYDLTDTTQAGASGLSDKCQANLCVFALNCDEPMYVKLVEALCAEHQINLIKVDGNNKQGEWVGLCKINREEKPHDMVGRSCVVVKDYGKECHAKDDIKEYFKCKK